MRLKLATTNLQHDLAGSGGHQNRAGGGCIRSHDSPGKPRLILLVVFFKVGASLHHPWLCLLGQALGFFGSGGTDTGFVPIRDWTRRKVVLHFDLGRVPEIRSIVNFGIDEGERHFGHAGRLAIASSGKDDVFHARTAQSLCRLLAEHPGNCIRNVRFPATVGADDGRDTVPVKLELGAVAERFEPENVELLQFEQLLLLLAAFVDRRALRLGCSPKTDSTHQVY